MYYPDETVEEVLRANDVVDIISPYVQLKRSGANYFGLCPFHSEKSPSFSVSPGKQIFYCFGCGAGGNALTFLMKYENCSFQEALKKLADRAGIRLPEQQRSEEMRKREERRNLLLSINRESAVYYYKMLRSPKGAAGLRYLEGRQLSKETMKSFGLGFADGASSDLTAHLMEKGIPDDAILEAGVAAFDEKRGLHDKFWNRVMFPIQDQAGRVIGFGGRVMGEGKPKYLNSPETPVFDKSRNLYGLNLARRSRKPYRILCEGYMDVIAMHQAGFTEAVASLGTSFTEGQAAILKRLVSEVILSYDSDEAGTRAAIRNMNILRRAGVRCRVLDLRPHKDPDEFIKAEGKEAFQKRIDEAENAFFFEIRTQQGNYRMDDPAQRTEFCRFIAKKLCAFEEEMERENYLAAAAQKYMIREDVLRRMVASYDSAGAGKDEEAEQRPRPRTLPAGGRESAAEKAQRENEKLLLTWIADEPVVWPQIRDHIHAEDFPGEITRRAAERFFQLLEKDPEHPGAAAAGAVGIFTEEEEQREAAALFETRLKQPPEDREKALKDILTSVRRASVQRLAAQADEDPALLTQLISAKKSMEALGRLKIRLP